MPVRKWVVNEEVTFVIFILQAIEFSMNSGLLCSSVTIRFYSCITLSFRFTFFSPELASMSPLVFAVFAPVPTYRISMFRSQKYNSCQRIASCSSLHSVDEFSPIKAKIL